MKFMLRKSVMIMLSFVLLLSSIQLISPLDANAAGVDTAASYDLDKLVAAIDQSSQHLYDSGIDHWEAAVGVALSPKTLPAGYAADIMQKAISSVTDDVYTTTDHAGFIMGLKAAGEDPEQVNGEDLVSYIMKKGDVKSTVNSATAVLISLDSGHYSAEGLSLFKQELVDYLLSEQHPNAGWDFLGYGEIAWDGNPTTSDVDMTGMVLTALAPYGEDPDVHTAIASAVDWLAEQLNEHGGITGWNGDSPSSIAQLILSLTSNGVNPTTDMRFVKANGNPISNLLSLYSGSGEFGENDSFGTRQGLQALIAFKLLLEDRGTLYGQLKDPTAGHFHLEDVLAQIKSVSAYLQSKDQLDWEELAGVVLSGLSISQQQRTHILNSVTDVADNGTQATVFASEILKVRAIGQNPETFGEVNLVHLLSQRNDLKSLVNNAAYSLLALDSGDYSVASIDTVKEELKDYLLSKQHPNAGWDYQGYGELDWEGKPTHPDVDTTGMVLAALAPYSGETAVQQTIDEAVEWLASQLNDRGGIIDWSGQDSPSSVAQVLIGLTANGIDPTDDARFVKALGHPISNLLSLYNGQGGFGAITDGQNDFFYTKQGLLGLLAYKLFVENKGSIYDVIAQQMADDMGGETPGDGSGDPGGDTGTPGGSSTPPVIPEGKTISVSVKGLNGSVIYDGSVTMTEKATPYSVLIEALGSGRVSTRGSGSSLYMIGIDGLNEFDYGTNSGWHYWVDGQSPGLSASIYEIEAGAYVEWKYTSDYVEETGTIGAGNANVNQTGTFTYEADEVLAHFGELATKNVKPIDQVGKVMHIVNAALKMSDEAARQLMDRLADNTVKVSLAVISGEDTAITDEKQEVALMLPQNALQKDTTIEIEEVGGMDRDELVSSIYEFGPSGTRFEKPITMSIKVPLSGVILENLALVWLNEETGEWIPVPAVIDVETGKVTGVVDHFTKFAVIDRKKLEQIEQAVKEDLQIEEAITRVIDYLIRNDEQSEWEAFAIAQAGGQVPDRYLAEIEALVTEAKGTFRKVTDLERLAIAVKALGGQPEDVAGYNLMQLIYNHEQMLLQGVNGPIFALIALHFVQYTPSAEAVWSEEALLQNILNSQNEDGGFSLAKGGESTVDITAMAALALSYYQEDADVSESLESAVKWLSEHQLPSGGYEELGVESSESVAQTIISLIALNIDPRSKDFTKANGDLIENLLSYQNEDGGFRLQGDKSNQISSEQALMALLAYDRYLKGSNQLFSSDASAEEVWIYEDDEAISGYAYVSVYKARDIGLMTGMEDGRFAPKQPMTRAQLVRVIIELLQAVPVSVDNVTTHFKDVEANKWYYDDIVTAEQLGLIAGVSQDRFEPDAPVTREHMALIIQRALVLDPPENGQDIEAGDMFSDIDQLSDQSKEAVALLYMHGILVGDQGRFNPRDHVTREMVAAVGYRLYQLLEQ